MLMNHLFSIFYCSDGIINHLCATCPLDGCTVYHRAIQGSKDVKMLEILLSKDKFHAGVNIQDKEGLSLLHLACKLNKKKVVSLLCVSFICFKHCKGVGETWKKIFFLTDCSIYILFKYNTNDFKHCYVKQLFNSLF